MMRGMLLGWLVVYCSQICLLAQRLQLLKLFIYKSILMNHSIVSNRVIFIDDRSQIFIVLLTKQFYILRFIFQKLISKRDMEEKQNEKAETGSMRKYRGRRNQKIGEEGNDFVLKRYRLEENRHFKEKLNEDLNYEIVQCQSKPDKEAEDIDDDLVIIPLQVPSDSVQPEQLSEKEVQPSEMVYVFDDDEEEDGKEVKIEEESVIEEQLTQGSPKREQLEPTKKRVRIKSIPEDLDQYNFKKVQRSNFSTAELMTPASHQSKGNIFSFNQNKEEKRTLEKKLSVKFNEGGLEKVMGVQFQKGQDQNETSITIVDKRLFAISRLPSGIILRCIIKRTNSFINLLSPEYDLYLANGLKHILSVKKYPMRNRQLFKFSVDPVKFTDQNLLSILHSNTNHNIYWLLDLPKRIGEFDLSYLQMVVGYYKMKYAEQQRRFTVLLPTVNSEYQLAIDYEQSYINFSSFKEEIKVQLNNVQKWENQANSSTKNFVLADQDDEEYRYLELKKESDNVFELTIQHPLSPLQAMAIAMTRFDAQLK